LDSAASFGLAAPKSIPLNPTLEEPQKSWKSLLLFSANHPESLRAIIQNYENYLEKHADSINDLAYTLSQRREHLKYRSFCVTDGSVPFEVSPQTKSQVPSQVAFVFTGQGAQWIHMGRQLMADYPSFLVNIKSMDVVLQKLEHAPLWSIEGIIIMDRHQGIELTMNRGVIRIG
jgi:acyl transferase domain-containing protein